MAITGLYDSSVFAAEQQGVGTIWLIATLGSRSYHSKVSKKDILSLSIPKVCETIGDMQQPLALRFSSSLLYGVALVYRQKTEYFYTDISTMRMRLSRDIYTKIMDKAVIPDFLGSKGGGVEHVDAVVKVGNYFFEDDQNFHLDIDMVPDLQLTDKRHDKNSIAEFDSRAEIVSEKISTYFDEIELPEEMQLDLTQAPRAGDDEFLVLDFGDLDRRSSQVCSRAITPLQGDLGLQSFDLEDAFGAVMEPQITSDAVEMVRIPKTKKRGQLQSVQMDTMIMLTTSELRQRNDEYVSGQVIETGKKFRNKIPKLEPEYYPFNDLEEFRKEYLDKRDYGFRVWNHSATDDTSVAEFERGRRQRSSSIASIERARRLSQSRSRSRSNSDLFRLPSLGVYGSQPDNDNVGVEFEQNFWGDEFLHQEAGQQQQQQQQQSIHDETTRQSAIGVDEFMERLTLVNAGLQKEVLQFGDLVDFNTTRSDAAMLFMRLLECASAGKFTLKNQSDQVEIVLR